MKALLPVLALALFFTHAASAQSEQPPQQPQAENSASNDPEIVVRGDVSLRERRAQLREMVTDIVNVPRDGRTVATYFEAICPRVIGLPEAESRVIEKRISQNAEALGANRRDPRKNCKHNLTVIFVPATKGPPAAWIKDDNDMIRHLLSYQRNEVLNDSDPVRAWTINEVRGVDGAPQRNNTGQRILGPLNVNNMVRLGSRMRRNSTTEITGSVVMFELASANGKTLAQLADYASMRTFGNVRSLAPDVDPAAETILTLFRDEDPPEGLTTFDRAVISKMYDTSRNSLANRYYTGIATRALNMEQEEREGRP